MRFIDAAECKNGNVRVVAELMDPSTQPRVSAELTESITLLSPSTAMVVFPVLSEPTA